MSEETSLPARKARRLARASEPLLELLARDAPDATHADRGNAGRVRVIDPAKAAQDGRGMDAKPPRDLVRREELLILSVVEARLRHCHAAPAEVASMSVTCCWSFSLHWLRCQAPPLAAQDTDRPIEERAMPESSSQRLRPRTARWRAVCGRPRRSSPCRKALGDRAAVRKVVFVHARPYEPSSDLRSGATRERNTDRELDRTRRLPDDRDPIRRTSSGDRAPARDGSSLRASCARADVAMERAIARSRDRANPSRAHVRLTSAGRGLVRSKARSWGLRERRFKSVRPDSILPILHDISVSGHVIHCGHRDRDPLARPVSLDREVVRRSCSANVSCHPVRCT